MKVSKVEFPTILHISLKTIPEIEKAIKDGLDVNQIETKGDSALIHYTCSGFANEDKSRGNIKLCEFLLSKGANPNLQDSKGYSPLHFAVKNNDIELAKLLLSKGANPNLQDKYGNIPLLKCRSDGKNDDLIRILLDAESDPKRVNGADVSALSKARMMGNSDTIKLIESYL